MEAPHARVRRGFLAVAGAAAGAAAADVAVATPAVAAFTASGLG
ncbi:hypothetical protein OCAE111667_01525 [Occultella aeris]|uniref:Uncharacterized protein n=1 Tax=Occultella aeris TaxID=2761496 RepID=A0A7M4DH26_9MICO|nr:hypothetical protein [Occultella aeris]VZO36219.1 hypothetical protein HALOF300_01423 [Occultella aeris]